MKVTVCTRNFENTHGKKPRGHGYWWFHNSETGEVYDAWGKSTIGEARKRVVRRLNARTAALGLAPYTGTVVLTVSP